MNTKISHLLLTALLVSLLPAFGGLSESELKHFRSNLEIGGVRSDTWKNEDRKKYELLEVNTFQSEDDLLNYDMSRFRMRLAVELTDAEKNTYLVKFTGNAPGHYDSEYQGEDYWSLYMEYGELDRLKVSGYVVQYGIMDEGSFVPLVEEQDDAVEMRDRVRKGETRLFPGKVYLRHHYMYDDSNEGVTESSPANISSVTE